MLISPVSAQVEAFPLFGTQRSDTEPVWRDQAAGASSLNLDSDASNGEHTDQNVLMELDIPGLVSLSKVSGAGVVYGAAASQGYGREHNFDQKATSGSVAVLEPYAGVYFAGHRTHFILEYHPIVDLETRDVWDGRVLQRAGFNSGVLLSRRWTWYLSGRGTYGPAVLQDIGLLSVGLQTYALPTDTILNVSGSTGLVWRRSLRHQFSFTVGDSYSSIQHGPSYSDMTARVQSLNGFGSRDSNWFVYADTTRYSFATDCTRVGFGAGVAVGLGTRTRVGVEAGPDFTVGHCVTPLHATFGGFLHQRLSNWTAVTLSAKRRLVEPTLLQSSYVDTVSGVLQQKTSRTTYLTAGASYIQGSSTPGQPLPGYRGFLFGSQFHWRVSNTASLIGSYQYFKRDSNSQTFPDRHSWVFFTFLWHPKGTTEHVGYE